MKYVACLLFGLLLLSCNQKSFQPRDFDEVVVEVLLEDSLSIRAIQLTATGELWFAANNGIYGSYSEEKGIEKKTIMYDTIAPYFRSIATNGKELFALSIANPALLYKLTPAPTLVYKEIHENVFYDAMRFWNEKEGIAMGDPTDTCLSVIITRDGGNTWDKLSCDILPEVEEGEAAFAASNTNIAIKGNETWLVSGGKRSRVYYSPDKGASWEVFETPIIQGEATQGGYSIDFYNEKQGVIFGGDYTKAEANKNNKAITIDGGKTWTLISNGIGPGYKSCVQYVPNSNGQELIAIGFTGISFSNDTGNNWKELSKESFYTIKFLNDTVAYAAGRNRIAKLTFR